MNTLYAHDGYLNTFMRMRTAAAQRAGPTELVDREGEGHIKREQKQDHTIYSGLVSPPPIFAHINRKGNRQCAPKLSENPPSLDSG